MSVLHTCTVEAWRDTESLTFHQTQTMFNVQRYRKTWYIAIQYQFTGIGAEKRTL